MRKKNTIIWFCVLAVLVSSGFFLRNLFKSSRQSIHIASVGPFTGSGQLIGKSLKQGINLYLDLINSAGGIDKKDIVVDFYDDQNKESLAKEKASEIVEDKNLLAVIGHWYSSCSVAGGNIYKKFGIPAITPGSTNVKVTRFNEWYFRTVFNDNLQGRFLANYAKKVLRQRLVYIIYDDDTYGSYLATVFEASAKPLGIDVPYKLNFKHSSSGLNAKLEQMIQQLKFYQNENNISDGLIFLATHAAEGVKIVKLIKDNGLNNPIMVPDSFASKVFQQGFDSFPKEREMPGYYTNNIYVTTHLIFDTANEKAQHFKELYKKRYNEEPDWIAAFAYDTIMILTEAIKRSNLSLSPDNIVNDRKAIRNALASINNTYDAIEGVTGLNYFNSKGDVESKPVTIGVYKSKNIISALIQLQPISNPSSIPNIQAAINDELIVEIDGTYMNKTNVVYTGIEINEISQFDKINSTAYSDFYLWFRYQGDIDPGNIEFLNIIDSIQTDSQDDNPNSNLMNDIVSYVDSDLDNSDKSKNDGLKKPPPFAMSLESVEKPNELIKYRLYRVKGTFKADIFGNKIAFDEHFLGASFKHKTLSKKNLIYVVDFVGMGNLSPENSLQMIKDLQLKCRINRWTANELILFQDIYSTNIMGRSENLSGKVDFSTYNFRVKLKKNVITLRGIIPYSRVKTLLIISVLGLLFFSFLTSQSNSKYLVRIVWGFETFFSFMLLLSAEVVFVELLSNKLSIYHLKIVRMCFDVLWWVIPAILLNVAIKRFVWLQIETKNKYKMPLIVKRFVSFVIYLLALIGIVAFVYEQEISKILATSGLFAMIIGFAVQMNISNLISGIAINLESPFRIGDWVKIGNTEGQVVDITWRSTRIQTGENCILSVPNRTATEEFISNFNYPDDLNRLSIMVHVKPEYQPARVRKILSDAALSAKTVLLDPFPQVLFKGLSDWSADYEVNFYTAEYGDKNKDIETVWYQIWIHLRYADIRLSTKSSQPETPFISVFEENSVLNKLDQNSRDLLRDHAKELKVQAQQTIILQGEPGDSIYLIREGVVSVELQTEGSETLRINRLGAGELFGEFALLSGKSRSANVKALTDTVLFEVKRADIAPILEKYPNISNHLDQVRVSRQSMLISEKAKHDAHQEQENIKSLRFFNRILRFFRR